MKSKHIAFVLVFLGLFATASCSRSSRESTSRDVPQKDNAVHEVQPDLANGQADGKALTQGTPHPETPNSHDAQHATDDHHHADRSHAHHHAHGDHNAPRKLNGLAIGKPVPDFPLMIGGEKRTLSEIRKDEDVTADGTLVLTFWCSFCHSCRDVEHPLDELAKKYKDRVGVIALDASAGETADIVSKFAEERGLTFPIAIDATEAADIFGVHLTTTTVIIDSQGLLRYRGRFRDNEHAYAEEALQAVLAGTEIAHKETPLRG